MKVKILFFLFCLVFSLLLTPTMAHAQANPATNRAYLNTNPDVPQNFHTYTQSVLIEILSTISCQISGVDPTNPDQKCLGVDSKTGKIGYVPNDGGLLGITGNMIGMTFNIPVSSSDYGNYLSSNFGISKKAYAQTPPADNTQLTYPGGIGFTGLRPIIGIWQIFRNLVYLIFVLLFVIVGLGIMMRIKIDPRTVMSFQNQIPKIIVAIIFVTFSYAIAGFMIDLMYVSMYLIFNLLSPAVSGLDKLNPSGLQGLTPFEAVGVMGGVRIASGAAGGIGSIIGSIFDGTAGRIVAGIVGGIIGGGIGSLGGSLGPLSIAGGLIGGIGGALLGSKLFGIVGGAIAFVVISIALLSALFRLWFQLLKCYIYFLISVVLGPIYIASGLIPGRSGVGSWMRGMLANLVPFPTTLTLLLIGKIFIDAFGKSGNNSTAFVPPFIGNPGNTSAFGALIGLAIILMVPEVANMAKEALKAPEFKYSSAWGKSVGVGAGIVGAGPKSGWNAIMRQPRWQGDQGGDLYRILATQGPNSRTMGLLRVMLGVHAQHGGGGPAH